MTIRRASYEEAKAIKSWDEFIGDRRVDNSRGELLVALDGANVVGYINYSSNLFYNRPYISLICVRETHRRKGIALELMKRVLEIYKGLDIWVSTEEWNQAAVALFQKLGFKKQGSIAGLNRDESIEVYFVLYGELK